MRQHTIRGGEAIEQAMVTPVVGTREMSHMELGSIVVERRTRQGQPQSRLSIWDGALRRGAREAKLGRKEGRNKGVRLDGARMLGPQPEPAVLGQAEGKGRSCRTSGSHPTGSNASSAAAARRSTGAS